MAKGWLTETLRERLTHMDELSTSKRNNVRRRSAERLAYAIDDFAFSHQHIDSDMTTKAFSSGTQRLSDRGVTLSDQSRRDALAFILGHTLLHQGQSAVEQFIDAAVDRLCKRHYDSVPVRRRIEFSFGQKPRKSVLEAAQLKVDAGRFAELSKPEMSVYLSEKSEHLNYNSYSTNHREAFSADIVASVLSETPTELHPELHIPGDKPLTARSDGGYKIQAQLEDVEAEIIVDPQPRVETTFAPLMNGLQETEQKRGIIVGPPTQQVFERLPVDYVEQIEYVAGVCDQAKESCEFRTVAQLAAGMWDVTGIADTATGPD